ncbi:anti-sigma factor family protein [Rhizorhabdus argentea]|uniref:anti-sigma factor family protein n=1 Tax=Rhizorhabdus argentea TaxID=1387174 RepID=UPI0030EC385F
MTEEQIIAYVDGELGPIEALRFERAMEADPAIAAGVRRHRRLRAMIESHFAPATGEPVPARLTKLVDNNVVAFPQRLRSRFGDSGRYAALAATLVAGLVAGQLLPHREASPIGERDGAVVAQGVLARALDTQLASEPQATDYHIGVSFRSVDNRYCRTFSGATGAGLGCHDRSGWTVERFVAGGPSERSAAYRQAASPSAEILAAAQDMMAGAPLDAEQERKAQAHGWRESSSGS